MLLPRDSPSEWAGYSGLFFCCGDPTSDHLVTGCSQTFTVAHPAANLFYICFYCTLSEKDPTVYSVIEALASRYTSWLTFWNSAVKYYMLSFKTSAVSWEEICGLRGAVGCFNKIRKRIFKGKTFSLETWPSKMMLLSGCYDDRLAQEWWASCCTKAHT